MQTHFANELNMNDGRDLYPVDLHSAAAQASKWMIAGNKGPQDVHTSFALLKKPEHKHKDKSSQKKSPVAEKSNEIPKKCTHCGIPGHTILECNKLKAALAAAQQTQKQSPPPPPKPHNKGKGAGPKKGTAMITQANSDDEDDHNHFMMSHIHVADLPATFDKRLFHSVNLGTTLATGGACTISDTEVILNTGANTSVVKNQHLLSDLRSTRTVKFDGRAGFLSISEIGNLNVLCTAYYHADAVANILSFSQLRENGHSITFNSGRDNADAFTVTTDASAFTFNKRNNGLYVCEFGNDSTLAISTVNNNESKFTKREAQAARALHKLIGYPPDVKLIRALQATHLMSNSSEHYS